MNKHVSILDSARRFCLNIAGGFQYARSIFYRRSLAVFIISLGLINFLPVQVGAASFACEKTATPIEKKICADPELSGLDEKLAMAYQKALGTATDKKSVQRRQREWFTTRNTCQDQACLVAAHGMRLAQLSRSGKENENDFSGQWHLELCNKEISDQCGGFIVYLVQIGNKLCGDHYFATPGLGRLNEGAPRSIIGTVTNNVADIVITSGRNGAVFRVRAIQDNDILDWKIVEEIKQGSEGDSALVLEKGHLKREIKDSEYQEEFSTC